MSYPRSQAEYYAKAYDQNIFSFVDDLVKSLPGLLSGTTMAFLGDPLNPSVAGAGSDITPTNQGPLGVSGFKPTKKGLVQKFARPVVKGISELINPPKNPMIVQHNINTEALERVQRAGGLPMPSMAVSKVDTPLTGFGDVSLLGGPEMAKPSAKNPVYGADAYTVRSPQVELIPNEKSVELVKKFYNIDDQYGDAVAKGVAEQILTKPGYAPQDFVRDIKVSFLKSKGINVGKPKSRKFEDRNEYNIKVDRELNSFLNDNGYDQFSGWLTKQKNKLLKQGGDFSERIFRGYTNIGNRRYAPATLENVVKEMKVLEKQRGAVGSDSFGTLGSFRSKVTPRFKSLLDVKKSRDKILTKEDFDIAKGDMEQKFENFQGQIMDYLEGIPGYENAPMRTIEELTSDLITGRSSKDWFPHDIPENIKIDAGKFRAELREMPTEYFEIKPKRGVELSEFQGAIIPQETSKTVKPILKEAGIKKIYQYGTDEERKELFKKFPELMFAVPILGAGLLESETQ